MDDAKTFKTDAIHEENPAIQDRTIAAVFADAATAEQARDALKIAGYTDIDITSGDPADDGKPVHEHGFWNRLKAMFGGHKDAPVYGEAVRRGNSLVAVHTEQGRASRAIDILDGFGPLDIQGGEQAWTAEGVAPKDMRDVIDRDVVPTPDTSVAGMSDSVLEEELILVEIDPDLGNDRVRGYSRNLPVVIDDHRDAEAPIAAAVKRAD